MDKKKERKKEVKKTIDYYEDWIEGSKRIKKLLHLEEQQNAVIIGDRDGPIMVKERGIEVNRNVFLHEVQDVLCELKEALNKLIVKWTDLEEDIESYTKNLDIQEEDAITKLLNSKKETIKLAKDIFEWVDDYFSQERRESVREVLEDPPFEELEKLAKDLKIGRSREEIVIEISMKV